MICPVFVALCPGDISVDSADTGGVFVNGAKAAVENFNNNYCEAKSGAVTISVSANGNHGKARQCKCLANWQ